MTDAERAEVLQQRVNDLEALVAALRAQLAQRLTPLPQPLPRPFPPGRRPYEPWGGPPWAPYGNGSTHERIRFGSYVFSVPTDGTLEVSL